MATGYGLKGEAGSMDSTSPKSKRKRSSEHEDKFETKKSKKAKVAEDGKKKKKTRKSKRRTQDSDDSEDPDSEDAASPPHAEPMEVETSRPLIEDDVDGKTSKKDKKDRKQKKEKNKRRKEEPEPTDSDVPVPDAEDVSMLEPEAPASEADEAPEPSADSNSKEGKKRDKRKKRKETEEIEDSDEDKAEKRHKLVLERKAKSLKFASENVQEEEDEEDLGELHGLEPLPQPEPSNVNASRPTYETLPSWLAEPIRVSQTTHRPFVDLGVLPKASRVLEEKGFKEAFAVQTAALPLLLPTSKTQSGDVLVAAATGSGKTLAYALPIVRDISQGVVTRLRALVVLPTRELVKQAQETFELCAKAYEGGERKRVRIGVSVGSQSLKYEQECFMDKETRYDPECYERLQTEAQEKESKLPLLNSEEADPRLSSMNGYVNEFMSKIDVLICTPGRLVEHMEQTPGFSLDFVRWLVVDEADKLLAQSFQGWLELVMEKFKVNRYSARDFPDMNLSGVRKVILSATLTRDLSLLNQLALRRPRLIVLESDGDTQIAEHSLPVLLKEFAIRVHDTNLKPLYLLELLQGQHMGAANPTTESAPKAEAEETSDSDTSSSDSSSSSDSDSDSDSDSSSSSSSDSDSEEDTKPPPKQVTIPPSLIFTKSNESALRLSRLLALLSPSLTPHIGTLTSTTPTHLRRKTLRAFTTTSSPTRLLIASDLVARGIDLPNLAHVINYDLPPSVAGYVHRVGRTARAGREGCAWTLVGDEESGWFWGKIAKGAGVKRAQKVERTRIEEMGEERVEVYEAALEKLAKEAGR